MIIAFRYARFRDIPRTSVVTIMQRRGGGRGSRGKETYVARLKAHALFLLLKESVVTWDIYYYRCFKKENDCICYSLINLLFLSWTVTT